MTERKQAQRVEALRLYIAASALLLAACASPIDPHASNAPPRMAAGSEVVKPPLAGLVATLQDEIRELPSGRIDWRTYWRLCWEDYPDAIGYELRAVTAEGRSREAQRQDERCFRIEAAAGENEKAQGLAHRDLLLAVMSGQLSYRVRALLPRNRASEWSAAVAVGKERGRNPPTR